MYVYVYICGHFQVFSRRPGRLHLIDYCSSTFAWFTLCLFRLLSDNGEQEEEGVYRTGRLSAHRYEEKERRV